MGSGIPFIQAGAKAPDFSLASQDGRKIRLSDYAGKLLILVMISSPS